MKRTLWVIFFLSLWIISSTTQARSPYQIGILDTAPYNESGKDSFSEKVRTVFRQAGHEIEIYYVPYKRGMTMVEFGGLDAMMPAVPHDEFKDDVLYSDATLLSLPLVLFTQKGRAFHWTGDFKSIAHTRLGALRSTFKASHLQKAIQDNNITLVEVDNYEQLVMMVALRRIDIGLSSLKALRSSAKRRKVSDRIRVMDSLYRTATFKIAFSRSTPGVAHLNTTISRILEQKKGL